MEYLNFSQNTCSINLTLIKLRKVIQYNHMLYTYLLININNLNLKITNNLFSIFHFYEVSINLGDFFLTIPFAQKYI